MEPCIQHVPDAPRCPEPGCERDAHPAGTPHASTGNTVDTMLTIAFLWWSRGQV